MEDACNLGLHGLDDQLQGLGVRQGADLAVQAGAGGTLRILAVAALHLDVAQRARGRHDPGHGLPVEPEHGLAGPVCQQRMLQRRHGFA